MPRRTNRERYNVDLVRGVVIRTLAGSHQGELDTIGLTVKLNPELTFDLLTVAAIEQQQPAVLFDRIISDALKQRLAEYRTEYEANGD